MNLPASGRQLPRYESLFVADSAEKAGLWESCFSVAQKTLNFGVAT